MKKGTIEFVGKVMLAIALYELAWYIYATKIAKAGGCGCGSKNESVQSSGFVTIESL